MKYLFFLLRQYHLIYTILYQNAVNKAPKLHASPNIPNITTMDITSNPTLYIFFMYSLFFKQIQQYISKASCTAPIIATTVMHNIKPIYAMDTIPSIMLNIWISPLISPELVFTSSKNGNADSAPENIATIIVASNVVANTVTTQKFLFILCDGNAIDVLFFLLI